MKHEMHLQDDPFNKIKNGTKTVELRLNDMKRKVIRVNDLIEFTNAVTNEKIVVHVKAKHEYDSFAELYKNYDKVSIGYNEDDIADPKDMEKYYSVEEQQKYKVVAIEIEK